MAEFLGRIAGASLTDRTDEAVEANQLTSSRAPGISSSRWALALSITVVWGLLSGPGVAAQTRPAEADQPPMAATVNNGAQLFRNHCATCHGATGQGGGPMADVLRKRPADLTRIAIKNGGIFPSERVRRIIDGQDVPSHGDRNMPVWGITLRTSREEGVSDSVEARIDSLVRYIQLLQERTGQ